jgi:hypothetical protein
MQYIVRIDAQGAQILHQAHRVSDVAGDHDVIQVLQLATGFLQRRLVEIDADQCQRVFLQHPTARRFVAHGRQDAA